MSQRLIAVFGILLALAAQLPAQEPKPAARPEVEVVFCLDTTGSMGGLIQAAKQKIWAISNQIASGRPTPRLKVGLVAFRDRKDQYVTKLFDLTDDLDAVHGHLQGLNAAGGGDLPESVNQALHEAITKMTWSKDAKTLKMIFLVGDAPPHMDYADDVKYPDSCKIAVAQNIIINTVQCGARPETKKYWEEICRLAEGSYVQIDQKGGPIVAVATPFDKELGEINREISKNSLAFGRPEAQVEAKKGAAAGAALPTAAAADRAGFLARNGAAASNDLLQSIKDGKVKLEDVKKEELPDELKNLSLAEQKQYLEKLDKTRQELQKKALELDQKRNEFLAKKRADDETGRPRDSFDQNVLRILQRQAARANIEYAVDEKKK
jgi:Mg-chelatase subunit ChlD